MAEAYDPRPVKVERIETHASIVFLAGDFAYKIKRAVKYPFLDFSTLDRRQAACLHELAVNRRTAPELYLGVVPVIRDEAQQYKLGAEDERGEAVEWVLVMRRFDQEKLYDRLAERGELPLGAMPMLAREVEALHRSADRLIAPGLSLERLSKVLDENLQAFGVLEPDVGRDTLAEVERVREVFAGLAPLLAMRAKDGSVRHCHGDLHLRNIVELGGKPLIFDAIEFDDAIATIDVLYDLAFLLMDLGARGLTQHANSVLNAYLDISGETANLLGLRALPLFLSLRAMVRAKVELLRGDHSKDSAREEARRRAINYLYLARDYFVTRPPRLIAIGGLSGSGKSAVARALAPRLGSFPGAVHVRSDVERKRLFGVEQTERLPQSAYAPEVTALVYAACRKRAFLALQGGQTVIVDAVHAAPEEREAIAAVAGRAGVAFTGLWLDAPRRLLRDRVARRENDVSDATPDIVDRQFAYDLGPQNFTVIDAKRPLEQVADSCLQRIGEVPAQTWLRRFQPDKA